MLTSPNKSLLAEIESYLSNTTFSASYLGKRAVGNSELIKRLRKGGRVWPETEAALRTFMAQNPVKRSGKKRAA